MKKLFPLLLISVLFSQNKEVIVDRAYVIANGAIVADGAPREIANSGEAKRLYFGEDFKI